MASVDRETIAEQGPAAVLAYLESVPPASRHIESKRMLAAMLPDELDDFHNHIAEGHGNMDNVRIFFTTGLIGGGGGTPWVFARLSVDELANYMPNLIEFDDVGPDHDAREFKKFIKVFAHHAAEIARLIPDRSVAEYLAREESDDDEDGSSESESEND